jgi:hypothetical protein
MTDASRDLEHHAADKVKRALKDVLALTDDVGDKMRIALMASSVCIGAAGAYLAYEAKRAGQEVTQKDAMRELFKILFRVTDEGAEAVVKDLWPVDGEVREQK